MLLRSKVHVYVPFCGTRGDMCGPVMAKHHGRKLISGEYWVVKAFIHQLPTIQMYQINLISEQ